jgi:RHO1 GDP-GTP exchange protein 1/2
METGCLVQIIQGNDVRCLWDGRGVNSTVVIPGPEDYQDRITSEVKVHAVTNAVEPAMQPGSSIRPSKDMAQHIFELLPVESLPPPPYIPKSPSPAGLSPIPST